MEDMNPLNAVIFKLYRECDRLCESDDPFDVMRGQTFRQEVGRLIDEWCNGFQLNDDFNEKKRSLSDKFADLLEELRKG